MRAAIVFLAFVVTGCASGGYASQHAPPTASHHPHASVSAQLKLPSRTLPAGSSMPARVIVNNQTGHAIHLIGCLSLFGAALVSSSYHPEPVWPACQRELTVPTGKSIYRVALTATYEECSEVPGQGRACLPGGRMPPLPPGNYRATLFQSSHVVSAPAPIPVKVTPRSLANHTAVSGIAEGEHAGQRWCARPAGSRVLFPCLRRPFPR